MVISTQSLAAIHIVGVDCLELITIDSETVVCTHPLPETVKILLSIKNNFDFVVETYQSLLLRQPDQPGETYWLNALNTNKVTKEQMLNSFINSTEYSQVHAR